MDDKKRKAAECGRTLLSDSGIAKSHDHGELFRQLDDAIQLLPTPEKEAYLEAVNFAPLVVQKETNPVWFMRWEKFNSWSAAESLALYWKLRKEIFGPDDYLKPMHHTGNGALSVDDIEVLDTASMCILPKSGQSGSYVLWWDRERLTAKQLSQRSIRYRVFFYLLHVLLMLIVEDEGFFDEENIDVTKKAGKIGVEGDSNSTETTDSKPSLYVLALLTAALAANHDFEFVRKVTEILQAFPIKVLAIHLVSVPSSGASAIMSSVAALAVRMLGTFLSKFTCVHIGTTMRELLQRLKDVGFDKRTLPAKIGGNWKDEKFEQFKRRRRRIEEEMFLSDEEKLIRKRQVNMIHSRQKRERRKIELEVLQEQCQELMQRNSGLRDDNKRLEDLIARAETEIKFKSRHSKADDSIAQPSGRFATLPQPPPPVEPGVFALERDAMNNQNNVANIDLLRKVLAMEQSIQEQHRNQNLQNLQRSLQLQQLLSAHGIQSPGDVTFSLPVRHEQNIVPFLGDSPTFSSPHGASSNQALSALAVAMQNRAAQTIPSLNSALIFNNNPNPQQVGYNQNLSMPAHGTQFAQESSAAGMQFGDSRSDGAGQNLNAAQVNLSNISYGGFDTSNAPMNGNAIDPINPTTTSFRPSWPW